MDKYFCVFKMPNQTTPMRVSFEAEHPGAAILKMMNVAKIGNTMELEQAELLKCVRTESGLPAYVQVFLKEKQDRKGKVILNNTKPEPTIDTAVVEKQLDVYTPPYTVEVL